MQRIDLGDIEKELRSRGFAVREGTLSDVSRAAMFQPAWNQVPQKGGANESTLRPMSQAEAPLRTLSKVHGFGAQPLHTDGAHLEFAPDVIVLSAAKPTPTPTIVWKLGSNYPSSLMNGVFTVRGNSRTFLAHALANQRLRFDPGCMFPADHLAAETVAYFEDVREDAHVHDWNGEGMLLFINNRRALHAREAVVDEADVSTRELTRAGYILQDR